MIDNEASASSTPNPDSNGDLSSMLEEIGTAVAMGLVPVLGQAVNIYDTVESLITLHNSSNPSDKTEAKFDLVLALIGWIPGAGGGVKQAVRIVNKNPERYAPLLFDVLRMICMNAGVKTSPEALLEGLFDAAGLTSILGTAHVAIKNSWLYEKMPSEAQFVVNSSMATVRAELPAMLALVTTKLTHWKRKQRNSAAATTGHDKKTPSDEKPAAKDPAVAKSGPNAPSKSQTNGTLNAQIGTLTVEGISKTMTGILGEHITDYFLYEEYGWGKNWSGHDQGYDGIWKLTPDILSPGKINDATKLNKLFAAKAHGTGLDGVWKVESDNPYNDRKPFAIIESKSSIVKVEPRNATGKPAIAGKLSDNARRIREATLPKPEDLLEPATSTPHNARPAAGKSDGEQTVPRPSRTSKPQPRNKRSPLEPAGSTKANKNRVKPIVQMSNEWIGNNIGKAVLNPEIEEIIRRGGTEVYSRHLFYVPFYLPSAASHAQAITIAQPLRHDSHADHDIPTTHRYGEDEVKSAVNKKLIKLGLPSETE